MCITPLKNLLNFFVYAFVTVYVWDPVAASYAFAPTFCRILLLFSKKNTLQLMLSLFIKSSSFSVCCYENHSQSYTNCEYFLLASVPCFVFVVGFFFRKKCRLIRIIRRYLSVIYCFLLQLIFFCYWVAMVISLKADNHLFYQFRTFTQWDAIFFQNKMWVLFKLCSSIYMLEVSLE